MVDSARPYLPVVEWKKRIARLTTNVLNPFLVAVGMIALLSFSSNPSASDAIKWSLILTAFSLFPVFAVVLFLLHNGKLDDFFIKARRQRNQIYLLSAACAIAGSIILTRLGAPLVLLASFVAALAAIVVFMLINLRWKISVHTAFIAASATILIVLFGYAGAVSAALVPPTAWARVELDHHSPAQAVTGALLASMIVVVVFYFFGFVGRTLPA